MRKTGIIGKVAGDAPAVCNVVLASRTRKSMLLSARSLDGIGLARGATAAVGAAAAQVAVMIRPVGQIAVIETRE